MTLPLNHTERKKCCAFLVIGSFTRHKMTLCGDAWFCSQSFTFISLQTLPWLRLSNSLLRLLVKHTGPWSLPLREVRLTTGPFCKDASAYDRLDSRGIGVWFLARPKDYSRLLSVQTGSGDHAAFCISEDLTSGVQRLEREAGRSLQSNDEVKMIGLYLPSPYMSWWRGC
jgi:hypothetical protein